jgi:hypothetical protein
MSNYSVISSSEIIERFAFFSNENIITGTVTPDSIFKNSNADESNGFLPETSVDGIYNGNLGSILVDRESMVYQNIQRAFQNQLYSAYVYQYKLTVDEVTNIVTDVVYTHPTWFWAQVHFTYNMDSNGYVGYIMPIYQTFDLSQKTMTENFNAEVENIMSGIDQENMTDTEKALYVHEYMATHYIYDMDIYENTETSLEKNEDVSYNCYDLVTKKTGVCQSHTLFFSHMMSLMTPPVETDYVLSLAMNHVWNVVKLDGEWYYIDNTWDDALNTISKNSHDYFLISKSTLDESHIEYIPQYETGNAYDNIFCRNIEQTVSYYDGDWYYPNTKVGYILRYNFKTGVTKQIIKIGSYSYTSVAVLGDYLYYNTANSQIHRVNPDGTGDVIIFDLFSSDIPGNIYGIMEEYGKIVFTAKSDISSDDVYYELVFDDMGNVTEVVPASRNLANKADPPSMIDVSDTTTLPNDGVTEMFEPEHTEGTEFISKPEPALTDSLPEPANTAEASPDPAPTDYLPQTASPGIDFTDSPGTGSAGADSATGTAFTGSPGTDSLGTDSATEGTTSSLLTAGVDNPNEKTDNDFVLADFIRLKKILHGEYIVVNVEIYDLSKDNILNVIDLNLLLYYLLHK